jgi:hypothetical protein
MERERVDEARQDAVGDTRVRRRAGDGVAGCVCREVDVHPPGISVYSREREVREEVEAEIRGVLARMVDEAQEQRDELERLVREVRVVGL